MTSRSALFSFSPFSIQSLTNMPLQDPFSLGVVRPAAVTETKTFKAQALDKDGEPVTVELTLTLRGLDSADDYVVQDRASMYARDYAPTDGSMPAKVVELGGRPIAMSFQMCYAIAQILVAQVGGEQYGFDALAAYVILLGSVWNDAMKWSNGLNRKAQALGKASSTA